ncbi:MAG TPA: anti-sigma factor [Actinomycetes bacterium]|nr:anti-sigma factor [Actinomycetes bacterium]
MNADIHTLTGAYAANALPADERVDFERHLRMCEACGDEVRELQATTALLGVAAALPPPPGLRERVLAEIGRVRQLGPELRPVPRDQTSESGLPSRISRWTRRAVAVGIAALVLAAAGLGVVTYQQRQDISQLEDALAGARDLGDLLAAPDVKVSSVTSGEATGTVVASEQRDEAVFLSSGLPAVPADKTYQLWVIGPSGPASAGLLALGESGSTVPALATDTGQAQSLAVTVEPAGGSPQPTTQPLLMVELPA